MSTCNDCYHCEVCHRRINGIDFLPITDGKINYRSIMLRECNDVENHCEYFKDKSTTLDLPCKVGDEVYYLGGHYERHKTKVYVNEVIKGIVDHITIGQKGVPQIDICDDENEWTTFDCVDDFGKIVFLTKEEAEKALERLKNNG